MSLSSRAKRALLTATLKLPTRVRRRLAGPPRPGDRATPLAADIHWMLWLERRGFKVRIAEGSVADARRAMRESVAVVEGPVRPGLRIVETLVAGVRCRTYARGPGQPRLVYLHGGGWTVGDLRTHDRFCQRLAADAGVEVIAVDYPLAPEHPFPEGLDAVVAVVGALRATPGPLALGGDSAGGNLTAAACLALARRGEPLPDLQVLIYPGTDMVGTQPSRQTFVEGVLLEPDAIAYYTEKYAAPDPRDPLTSPFYAPVDALRGQPPAIVLTAGFDPLRDEGEAYARHLEGAGVAVTRLDAADQPHGFVHMDGVCASADHQVERLVAAIAAWARDV